SRSTRRPGKSETGSTLRRSRKVCRVRPEARMPKPKHRSQVAGRTATGGGSGRRRRRFPQSTQRKAPPRPAWGATRTPQPAKSSFTQKRLGREDGGLEREWNIKKAGAYKNPVHPR